MSSTEHNYAYINVNKFEVNQRTVLDGTTVINGITGDCSPPAGLTVNTAAAFTCHIEADEIDEYTLDHGVTIDGALVKDGTMYIDGNLGDPVEHLADKNQPNGYAGLDSNGKIPISLLSAQPLIYRGTWNAMTNTPTLVSSVGTNGDYWIVSVAGNTNLNGYTNWQVGDAAVFENPPGQWVQLDSAASVASVNSLTGAVDIVAGTNVTVTTDPITNTITVSASSGSGNATALQGNPISATAPTTGQLLYWNGTDWIPTTLAGDVTGNVVTNTVSNLQGTSLSISAPLNGEVLEWNGTAWVPASLGGDVTGNFTNNTLSNLQGNPVSASTPASGQVLGWNGTNWVPVSSILSFATVVTSGGTTALTNASATTQNFTGTSNQTVTLPAIGTMTNGAYFTILSNTTGTVTIKTFTNATAGQLQNGGIVTFTCVDNTGALGLGGWFTDYSVSDAPSGFATFCGANAFATSAAVAFGAGATASGIDSTAIGYSAIASGQFGTALGQSAQVVSGVSIGNGAYSVGTGVSIGSSAQGLGTNCIVIGDAATDQSIAYTLSLGYAAKPADTAHSIAITANPATLNPGTIGLSTYNGTSYGAYQLPMYSSYFASTPTAAGTTTLTATSAKMQYFTGTTIQTVVLPDVTTLSDGFEFKIVNQSTGVVTVQSSGGNTVAVLNGTTAPFATGGLFTCINTAGGTGTASWSFEADDNTVMDILAAPTYPLDTTSNGVWYGTSTKANGAANGVTLGNSATTSGSTNGVAVGQSATATGSSSVAIGPSAGAPASNSVSIGLSATINSAAIAGIAIGASAGIGASGGFSVVVGDGAASTNVYGVALGPSSSVTQSQGIAIGYSSNVTGTQGIGIGPAAAASNTNGIGIGYFANASGSNAIAFGASTVSSANNTVAVGPSASASAANDSAFGQSANASGGSGVAVGSAAVSAASAAVAVGSSSAGGFNTPATVQATSTVVGPVTTYEGGTEAQFQTVLVTTTFILDHIVVYNNTVSGTPFTVQLYSGALTGANLNGLTLLASTNAIENNISYNVDFSSFNLLITPGSYTFGLPGRGVTTSWGATNAARNASYPTWDQFAGFNPVGVTFLFDMVNATNGGINSVALGPSASTWTNTSIAIGHSTNAVGTGAITVGPGSSTGANNAIAVGNTTVASAIGSIAVGASVNASAMNTTAVGTSAVASSTGSTALGFSANAGGNAAIALGFETTTTANNSIVIGQFFTNNLQNTAVIAPNTTEALRVLDPAIGNFSYNSVAATISGTTPTPTEAQLVGGYINLSGTGALTLTIGTAGVSGTSLSAYAQLASNTYVGLTFRCLVIVTDPSYSTNNTAITVSGTTNTASNGITPRGVLTAVNGQTRQLTFINTGANTWDMIVV